MAHLPDATPWATNLSPHSSPNFPNEQEKVPTSSQPKVPRSWRNLKHSSTPGLAQRLRSTHLLTTEN